MCDRLLAVYGAEKEKPRSILFHVFFHGSFAILSLPLVSRYFEFYWELLNEIRFVETKIVIKATPEKIWKNIIRIPELEKTEDGFFIRWDFRDRSK
ncbi:hypothetical protein LEP1GSC125_3921 [Leptospira mayottensis 200901122]|uniref:Uncharacterized protein n=1 Tax=Leptospira mayottensis 200901122 TaxID=1193010 RepID=A0AA87SY17_9LEPT|nr:hypothetical protein LEP1GSC125_3921 [Leptospira mayottensis 200901122]